MSWYRQRKMAAQFIDPFPGRDPDNKLADKEIVRAIRQALAGEEEAVHLYDAIIDATNNEIVQTVLESIRDEERVHIGELQGTLKRISSEERELLEKGEKEVKDIL